MLIVVHYLQMLLPAVALLSLMVLLARRIALGRLLALAAVGDVVAFSLLKATRGCVPSEVANSCPSSSTAQVVGELFVAIPVFAWILGSTHILIASAGRVAYAASQRRY